MIAYRAIKIEPSNQFDSPSNTMNDVMSNRVPLVLDGYAGLAPAIKGNLIKGLAATSLKRLPGFENLPTVAETVPDSDLIDDAVQDTFIKAMEQMSALREADQVSAWLTSIAESAATDAGGLEPTIDGDKVSEAELAEVRELVHLVRGAFTALSPRDLRAVAHVGYLNASTDDLAESLKITPAATTRILHRAHGRLRNARKLELLVRQAGGACAEFVALVNASKVHEAGKHLAFCSQCQQAAVGLGLAGYQTKIERR